MGHKKRASKPKKQYADVQKETLERLETIRKKLKRKSSGDVANEFFDSVEAFFESHFDMGYEFTYEELMAEVDRRKKLKQPHKEKIKDFSQLASSLKYRASDPNTSELEALINQFQEIVESITHKSRITRKSKPKERISVAAEHIVEEAKSKIEHALHHDEGGDQQLKVKIRKAESALKENDIYRALDFYEDIQKEFDKLPPSGKKNHFDRILKLHSRLEELKNVFSSLAYHEDDIIEMRKGGSSVVTGAVESLGGVLTSLKPQISEHNIQRLIIKAEDSLEQHDIKTAANTYSKLRKDFRRLSVPVKKVYHKKIIDIHKKIISYAS